MSCNPTIESASSAQGDRNGPTPAFKKAKFAWQIKGKGRNIPKESVASTSTLLDSERVPWTAATSEQHENDAEKEQEEEDEEEKDKEEEDEEEDDEEEEDEDEEDAEEEDEEEVESWKDQHESDVVDATKKEQRRKTDEFYGIMKPSPFPFDCITSLVRTDADIQSTSCFPTDMMAAQRLEHFLTSIPNLNRTNYNLRKWQTQQLSKGNIDNDINKILDDMGFSCSEDDECSEQKKLIKCNKRSRKKLFFLNLLSKLKNFK